MYKFKVEVTENDIKEGVPEESSVCPIAIAFKRIGFADIGVGSDDVYVFGHNEIDTNNYLYGKLPPNAKEFISNFDDRRLVKPFEFEINLFETNEEF